MLHLRQLSHTIQFRIDYLFFERFWLDVTGIVDLELCVLSANAGFVLSLSFVIMMYGILSYSISMYN